MEPRTARWLRNGTRSLLLLCLFAGPLAIGAVHEPVFIPLLAVLYLTGLASWAHGHWARSHGHEVPVLPGRKLLLAFHALVLFQLLPLPRFLLGVLSPFSARFHSSPGWHPITASPELTLRGLAFLVAMTALYATVFREFRSPRWRQRLILTVVATGVAITVVALVQSRSADPASIYGFWKPRWDWAVLGPYVNRNHFAGFVVMAVGLSLGGLIRNLRDLGKGWTLRQRSRWLAFFDPSGLAMLRWLAVAMFLLVGLLLAASRAGFAGLAGACCVLFLMLPRRRGLVVLAGAAAIVGLALLWADFDAVVKGFESRGVVRSRIRPWADQARLVPQAPVFGAGFNALAVSYTSIQTNPEFNGMHQAHNEYFQVLLDTGLVGVALLFPLLWRVLASALRLARRSATATGLAAAIYASATNNLFDFNWQIPANAAVFFALAALVTGMAAERGRSLTLDEQQT